MNNIEKRFTAVPEADMEAEDMEAIQRIEKASDTGKGITLHEMDQRREARGYSGKISLRIPKSLHRDLTEGAQKEGISLNQFILYRLAK